MLHYLTLIVCCQLAGELIVTALKAPLPGPVLGMALLFAGLVGNGGIPDDLSKVADGLLQNLSLLFVPAGTGIMLHVGLISRDLVPISVSLVLSTIATIAVTSTMMAWLSPRESSGATAAPGERNPLARDPVQGTAAPGEGTPLARDPVQGTAAPGERNPLARDPVQGTAAPSERNPLARDPVQGTAAPGKQTDTSDA